MSNFIIYSVVASIVLTVVLNVLPLIFPNAAAKLQKESKKMQNMPLSNMKTLLVRVLKYSSLGKQCSSALSCSLY
jgi:hypothetical protein